MSPKLSVLDADVATKPAIKAEQEQKGCEIASEVADTHAVKAGQNRTGPHTLISAPVGPLVSTPAKNKALTAILVEGTEMAITQESRAF